MFKYISATCLLMFSTCSPDNDSPLLEEQVDNPVIGVYDEENRWIYGQMNHNYLWREDMPDSLSCDYTTDPVTFYKALLSSKDRFSYCMRNPEYWGLSEQLDYGFDYQEYVNSKGQRLLQVLYVTADELKHKLYRGDWLCIVSEQGNIKSFEKGTICNGEFQPNGKLSIAARSWNTRNNQTVYTDSIYSIEDKRIGYLCYLQFEDIADLEVPMQKFYQAGIDELVLDLRYNPGGYVNTCRYLCNSIVPAKGYGEIFQQCSYNNRLSEEYKRKTGNPMTVEYYREPSNNDESILGISLYGLNLGRIYILTSKNTASASEAVIVCLRPYMDVYVIGEQTYGKGVGSITFSERKYKYTLQPIVMRYYNALMETTPDGGIPVEKEITGGYETVKKNLGDTNEPLLAAALYHIEKGEFETVASCVGTRRVENVYLTKVGEPSFFQKLITEY